MHVIKRISAQMLAEKLEEALEKKKLLLVQGC